MTSAAGAARRCPSTGGREREFSCGGTRVRTDVTYTMRDVPNGWAVPVPGIHVLGAETGSIVRVRSDAHFGGAYLAACDSSSSATVRVPRGAAAGVASEARMSVPRGQTVSLDIPETDGLVVEIEMAGVETRCALVRADAVDLDRTSDVPLPPAEPPDVVRALADE
jgi:hypothetical protein